MIKRTVSIVPADEISGEARTLVSAQLNADNKAATVKFPVLLKRLFLTIMVNTFLFE